MPYTASKTRYDKMIYRRCGKSGVMLPAVSLGYWNNFGDFDSFENCRNMTRHAFDLGITHFDLANNYGPPYGSAETTFGRLMDMDMRPYRDEMFISSKAGYDMWDGPYGNFGSRKYLIASLDQSLKRMNLDYVDLFYHHRMDPETPLEETMGALASIVQSGKALYVGISNYSPKKTKEAHDILKSMGIHLLIHQPRYSMFDRAPETTGLFGVLEDLGMGAMCFSPLAQGLLSGKYNDGIPADSRAANSHIRFLNEQNITASVIEKCVALATIAARRGQTTAQLALAWVLRVPTVTSVLIGASKVSQIDDNVGALQNLLFSDGEIREIEGILKD